jgi:hypothetical protein
MMPCLFDHSINLSLSLSQVKPDWSAPAHWTEPAIGQMPFLPGMKHDFFKTNNVRVFATESGSNNKDLLEFMIVSWIIPLWREYHATGPLVILQDAPRAHGWTPELCEFSAKNEVFIAKFPHNSTTMTQCLDVHYFKAFRKIYRELCENLRAAWEFECGYLDYSFECQFRA